METIHQQLQQFTARDGYPLAVRVWRPQSPRGRAVIVHGLVSHSGWYLKSCEYLASQQIEVHFLDRRGSGLNLAERGDVRSWRDWLQDVEDYLLALSSADRSLNNRTPLNSLLLGMSWGGKFVAAFARYRPELVQGIVMICPGVFAYQEANSLKRAVLKTLGITRLDRLSVTIPLRDPGLFTATSAHQRYIAQDPFTLRRISARFALADLEMNQLARTAPGKIELPTLLMLSGRDRICDNARTRAFFEELGASDKKLIEYPEWGHTLEFEPDPQTYFNDLTSWVLEHVGS